MAIQCIFLLSSGGIAVVSHMDAALKTTRKHAKNDVFLVKVHA